MKKKLFSLIITSCICFSPILNTFAISNDFYTQVYANSNELITVGIALNNQTVGGSYTITITDYDYNSISSSIATSGSTAYFDNIEIDKEYMITVIHNDNPTQLWYFGKHSFNSSDNGQTLYVKVTQTPVNNYSFTGTYTSLADEGYNAQIMVAGAYANIDKADIYKGYFENYISNEYKVDEIIATFNMNGFVTGDQDAIIYVETNNNLPAHYAVVRLDSVNNNLEAIYYNTNSYPICQQNNTMFSINLSDFHDSTNFAVVRLDFADEVPINFYNNIDYVFTNYTYTGENYNKFNFATGGSIPTTGYISAFRNVSIGDVINLDALNISNVSGWYYDIIFKNEVYDTSAVVVTQDILVNGLYPKYSTNSIYNRSYSFMK